MYRSTIYLPFLSTLFFAAGMFCSHDNPLIETIGNTIGIDLVKLHDCIDSDDQSEDTLPPDTGLNWNHVTDISSFNTRTDFSLTSFKGKLYIIGGEEVHNWNPLNDVWASTDGILWNAITSHAPFPPRTEHQTIVFNNRLWVIGGNKDESSGYNDIWYTENGEDWIQVVIQQNWTPRGNHECVVFKNKLWIIGGIEGDFLTQITNDIWYSEDGETWNMATKNPFPGHVGFECIVKDDKIWLIGGSLANDAQTLTSDIYYSNDGINWELAGNSKTWSERAGHQCVVFNDKIWILGGYNYYKGYYNDAWYSENGMDWNLLQTTNNWPARDRFSATIFNNTIYVIGGFHGEPNKQVNDVWNLKID
jgi:hypothetical protein